MEVGHKRAFSSHRYTLGSPAQFKMHHPVLIEMQRKHSQRPMVTAQKEALEQISRNNKKLVLKQETSDYAAQAGTTRNQRFQSLLDKKKTDILLNKTQNERLSGFSFKSFLNGTSTLLNSKRNQSFRFDNSNYQSEQQVDIQVSYALEQLILLEQKKLKEIEDVKRKKQIVLFYKQTHQSKFSLLLLVTVKEELRVLMTPQELENQYQKLLKQKMQHIAAIKIQVAWKSQYRQKKFIKQVIFSNFQISEVKRVTTRIQSYWRGYTLRRQLPKIKLEYQNRQSFIIQRVLKGYLVHNSIRNDIMKLKLAKNITFLTQMKQNLEDDAQIFIKKKLQQYLIIKKARFEKERMKRRLTAKKKMEYIPVVQETEQSTDSFPSPQNQIKRKTMKGKINFQKVDKTNYNKNFVTKKVKQPSTDNPLAIKNMQSAMHYTSESQREETKSIPSLFIKKQKTLAQPSSSSKGRRKYENSPETAQRTNSNEVAKQIKIKNLDNVKEEEELGRNNYNVLLQSSEQKNMLDNQDLLLNLEVELRLSRRGSHRNPQMLFRKSEETSKQEESQPLLSHANQTDQEESEYRIVVESPTDEMFVHSPDLNN